MTRRREKKLAKAQARRFGFTRLRATAEGFLIVGPKLSGDEEIDKMIRQDACVIACSSYVITTQEKYEEMHPRRSRMITAEEIQGRKKQRRESEGRRRERLLQRRIASKRGF